MLALGGLLLSSCAVGPNFVKPEVTDITPAKWKWQTAEPRDSTPRGEWWTVFKDSELNRLEKLAVQSNQELRGAVARVDQSRSVVGLNALAFAPDIHFDGVVQRERTSGNQPTPVPIAIPAAQINSFSLPLNLSYEIDLWGRVRRSLESAKADAEAVKADYYSVLLSLTGDVAANYFLLRSQDAELVALRRTLGSQEKTIGLIDQRFKAGTIPEADLAKAQSELATTKADLADVKRQREETVSLLALLCGQPASNFNLPERAISGNPPKIPAGIPASLLERRPDVAGAERTVAARNADIGAAVAEYFPKVSLTGQGGVLSKETSTLFTADSKVWSFGPSVSLPITGFFVTQKKVQRAKAIREEAIANYRQSLLAAIKDVEVSLTQIRYRREQSVAQQDAVVASAKATELTQQRYESGATSYLELLDAERTSLARERQAAQVKAQSFVATVRLIKALGGAW
jgi:outer membrane protein, multidrug efflux system